MTTNTKRKFCYVLGCREIAQYEMDGMPMCEEHMDRYAEDFKEIYVASRAAACKAFPPLPKQLKGLELSFLKDSDVNHQRLSFMYGVAERLVQRAREEKQTTQKEEPTGRYALVVVEKSKRVHDWVKENMNVKHGSGRGLSLSPDAYKKGQTHANTLDLMNRNKIEKQTGLSLTHQR